MKNLSALLLFIVLFLPQQSHSQCLHNGCEMSAGKTVKELKATATETLRTGEFEDNILTAVSWNIDRQDGSIDEWTASNQDVCRFLKDLNPTFLGFQDVNASQLKYIKLCMSNYVLLKDTLIGTNIDKQNILAIKNTRRVKIQDYGSFETSPINPRSGNFGYSSCTWARISFAHRITEIPLANAFELSEKPSQNMIQKLYELLSLLLPKRNTVDVRNRARRSVHARYRWSNIFVAVAKINFEDENTAVKQTRDLLKQLRNKILERRRFPLVLMIDLGHEDNSMVYKILLQNRHWLRNTMVHALKKFPAMTKLNKNDPSSEMLSDHVFKHRMHGLTTAVISDDLVTRAGVSSHRPVYSSLMRFL